MARAHEDKGRDRRLLGEAHRGDRARGVADDDGIGTNFQRLAHEGHPDALLRADRIRHRLRQHDLPELRLAF